MAYFPKQVEITRTNKNFTVDCDAYEREEYITKCLLADAFAGMEMSSGKTNIGPGRSKTEREVTK
jgi:hypothetical protein